MKKAYANAFVRAIFSLMMAMTTKGIADPAVQAVSLADPSIPLPAGGNADSAASVISADGRFVVFISWANNLVTNDDNGAFADVFLRDRTNNVTMLISANTTGNGGGNGNSISGDISADGRFVAFESEASNLIANDTNGVSDIFLRDLQNGTTALVSVNNAGTGGNGASTSPSISADGRYVVFVSDASDLVLNDTNGVSDVFVRDLQTGTTALVSGGSDGSANGGSDNPTMTPDGRWVAFVSKATNLVAGVTNNQGEIYALDLVSGTTIWVSTNASAIMHDVSPLARPIASYNPVISANGGCVVFKSVGAAVLILRYDLQTGVTDLISTNTVGNSVGFDDPSGPDMTPDGRFIAFTEVIGTANNGYTAVYLWDTQNATRTLVSANLSGIISSNTFSDTPAISADGRFVTFLSDASDLATDASDGTYQVYLRDVLNGVTKLVSTDVNGGVSGETGGAIPTISADGRYVAFDSFDGGYVADDDNNAYDVFVRDTTTDTTELISQADASVHSLTGNGLSSVSANSVSADGRYVVFASMADNLAVTDTNGYPDIFVRDLQAGTNILVSANSAGTGTANGYPSTPVISADGRFVAFVSSADDLTPGQTNRVDNVYVRDLQAGTTSLVSVSTNGTGGNAASSAPLISADGRYVAFLSAANNLVQNDRNFSADVFWRDLQTGTTISASPAGNVIDFSMSEDGRRIAFVAGLPTQRLFVWDADSRALIHTNAAVGASEPVVSADGGLVVFRAGSPPTGYQLIGHELSSNVDFVIGPLSAPTRASPQISSNGRFVTYVSGVSNAVPDDTNNASDVFLYDLQTETTTLVSFNHDLTGSGNGASDSPTRLCTRKAHCTINQHSAQKTGTTQNHECR